ncbi:MAG: RNA methyltransferase [Flavobacteriaceae bacterium]|nr:RNA methyltransferase [Flavobacteriaceae bacterium]
MHKQITSVQNPLIKQVLLLSEKSRERKKQGLFVIEGQREISLAICGGFEIKTLLFCAEILESEVTSFTTDHAEIIEISREVYEKLAYRGSTEGILAIAKTKETGLDQLTFQKKNPLILIAEAPEKPGNIGALLRTADAANLDAVIIANPKTDLYNPNIVRSSVGGLFINQIASGSTKEVIAYLQENNIGVFCAALQASKPYIECDFTQAAALVVGTEATGLSEDWLNNSTQNIVIPMQGQIDSMNVSVAAGILIFEAKRQRNFE